MFLDIQDFHSPERNVARRYGNSNLEWATLTQHREPRLLPDIVSSHRLEARQTVARPVSSGIG